MSSRPLLSSGPEADEATRLRREIAGLEKELAEANEQKRIAEQASADSIHVIRALRNSPLKQVYDVLRMVFGEISRVEVDSMVPENAPVANSGIWTERISKSTGAQRRILQVLLDGGGAMELQQIRQAAGTGGGTSGVLNQLQAKNWVQKLGAGQWALK